MRWLKAILAWLFPFYCLGCGQIDQTICSKCLNELNLDYEKSCAYCLRFFEGSGLSCDKCLRDGAVLDGLVAAVSYDRTNLILKALYNFKYHFQMDFKEPLGKVLSKALSATDWNFEGERLCLSYIPLHQKKLLIRGFNQAEILAKEVANLREGKFRIENLLERISYDKAQMSLKKAARINNIRGAFRIKEGVVVPEQVVIIDDVATTLATLDEAAKVLKKAGVKKVYALVLARQLVES